MGPAAAWPQSSAAVKPSSADAANGLVPDRDILYKDETVPVWKKAWDQARELSRQGRYDQALVQYVFLLARKGNIDEARWEYTSILMYLKRWRQAGSQLDILISNDPENRRYLLARARVSLATGQVDQAVTMFGQLYDEKPAASDATEALAGLIEALEKSGKSEIILPLVDQLILRRPDDPALQVKAADLALAAGLIVRAREYLENALRMRPGDPAVMRQLALIQERLGHRKAAVILWQRILDLKPDDVQAHRHLARYYDKIDDRKKELEHIQALLAIFPADTALLKRAAELNLQTGRADRALDYFTWYLALHPDDTQVRDQQEDAREELARNLLALVENSRTEMLWQDLVQVTTDRIGVYRAMARLLRGKGRDRELIEVLRIIHQQEPGDQEITDELDRLLARQKSSTGTVPVKSPRKEQPGKVEPDT